MSNTSISSVLVAFGPYSMGQEAHVGPDLPHRNGGQISHAHRVVGGAGESEDPVHFANSAMPNLSHECDRLQPAEELGVVFQQPKTGLPPLIEK
jgi:hypothetical protein